MSNPLREALATAAIRCTHVDAPGPAIKTMAFLCHECAATAMEALTAMSLAAVDAQGINIACERIAAGESGMTCCDCEADADRCQYCACYGAAAVMLAATKKKLQQPRAAKGHDMPETAEITFPTKALDRLRERWKTVDNVMPELVEINPEYQALRDARAVIEHLESDAAALRATIDFMRVRVQEAIEPR